MNAEIVSSLLTQEVPAGTTSVAAVPVDHLDYGYIELCTDVKYLGKILRVLRSGDEGIYPHLIQFCESRLERLDPTSRALRKDNPPATAACFSGDEWSQIADELKKWEIDAKMSETELKQQSLFRDLETANVPPVRGSNCSLPLKQNAVSNGQKKTARTKKVLPRNYIEWDQFDVDKECDKIDGNLTKKDPAEIVNSRHPKIRSIMDTTALTEQEKVLVANREKDKGNEAFKANDYEEAVVYYTRSLSVVPTVAGYNNRAQSEIKLQRWHNALNDCQKVLQMEPGNMKALLRRATVLKQSLADSVVFKALLRRATVLKQSLADRVVFKALLRRATVLKQFLADRVVFKALLRRATVLKQSLADSVVFKALLRRATVLKQSLADRVVFKALLRRATVLKQSLADSVVFKALLRRATVLKQSLADRVVFKALLRRATVLKQSPADSVVFKALLRRATVLKQQGNYQRAAEDLRNVLQTEPQNITATKLLVEVDKKLNQCQPEKEGKSKRIPIQEVEEEDEIQEEQRACPVEPSEAVGGESAAAAPAERGDMGNAQKKPHGRGGEGGPSPHTDHNSHGGHWKNRGGIAEKYKVTQQDSTSDKGLRNGAQGSGRRDSKGAGSAGGDGSHLDAPCGALPPPLARLKNEGNLFFKNGQFADALDKYSQAITGFTDSGLDSPEDLGVLYSNRAACYLKDGNSSECIQDCTRSLELQPFSLKPLLRRAMAYETMERYRQAYVDYKTVLQIDISVQAAHDSVNRITRLLIEQDGEQWREKLPEIPLVPLSAQQHRREEPPSAEVLQARAEKAKHHAAQKAEVCFNSLKQEGNEFVKKGQFQEALRTYSECLKLKPEECPIYTNRALCFLKLDLFAEAKQDCDSALRLEPANKKAFYRRAMANKGLKDYLACSSDLQEVLQQDPNVAEAEKELEEVTLLLRQSLARGSPSNPRRTVPITEVEGTEDEDGQAAEPDRTKAAESETTSTSTPGPPENHCGGGGRGGRGGEEAITINLQPSNAYEFNQSLNAARAQSNLPACAELLSCVPPETLPVYLSNQLDGHTVSFIMQALETQLLQEDPNLVYQHLNHLHTADRFSVVVMPC
ncbi:sperm-associated antigen 1-like isoform X2 [Salvelinus fontinalis]|uniref:sperm-associated antigen 1-like isoform X2 n=1 Tax=Salvelinus fontinalis TaxID=8038 RepID=UPI0024854F21|nr:sperm-associated antigen 1-like isoform X2 [Salvelinus fontinalis]